MSMTGEYQRVLASQFDALMAQVRYDPYALENYLYPETRSFDPPDPELSIGKAWAGLHFLLNGSEDEIISHAGSIVHGGKGTGADQFYGPIRVMTPEYVKFIAAALVPITEDWFLSRFDPAAFHARNIYPGGDWSGPEEVAWLWKTFQEVRDFFQDGARYGDAMLLYIT